MSYEDYKKIEKIEKIGYKILLVISSILFICFSIYFIRVGIVIMSDYSKVKLYTDSTKVIEKINYGYSSPSGSPSGFNGCITSTYGNKICNYEVLLQTETKNDKFIIASSDTGLKPGDLIKKLYVNTEDNTASLSPPFYTRCDGMVYISLGVMLGFISITNFITLICEKKENKNNFKSYSFVSQLNDL